ncbi:serine/threonine-protein kinase [Salix suchowensis]|nr:serine/threonine-protein kinase [Salix suchowensis]
MQAISPLITLSPSSPSFNSYSSDKLAEIAARVVLEFSSESEQPEGSSNDIFSWRVQEEEENNRPKNDNEEEEEEEEFEFAVLSMPEPQFPPMSADDIFYNGQIRPFYPLFNTKLLLDDQESLPKSKTATDKPGTYCVWTAKKEEGSLGSCKKSSSTGSNSKRWKFKDLLHRSNSDGKDTFVFLTPNNKKSGGHKRFGSDDHESKNNKNKESTEKRKEVKGAGGLFQLQQQYYAKGKEGDKRRSYLPYRPDLVGFLSNVNGVGRNIHPF